jgi:hypothetical protein
MSDAIEKKAPPIAFLLECGDGEIGAFELARLSEVANLRADMLALFDRLCDTSALAVLAGWLRQIDRQELKRQLLESPNAKLEEILARAQEAVRNQGRSQEETKEDGAMPSPWLVRQRKYLTDEERRAARTATERQSREKALAAGKCEKCTEPLDRNSVRYCTKHLAMLRERDARDRQKKGIKPGTQGRQPGTLTALAASRDKKSLAVLAEWGIRPKHAAVSPEHSQGSPAPEYARQGQRHDSNGAFREGRRNHQNDRAAGARGTGCSRKNSAHRPGCQMGSLSVLRYQASANGPAVIFASGGVSNSRWHFTHVTICPDTWAELVT